MSMITESYPFCYAMKNDDSIKLYILIKVPAGKKIAFPNQGTDFSGQTKFFQIDLEDAGSDPDNAGENFKNYEFNRIEDSQSIDTVEVYTQLKGNNNPRIKTMKIAVSDMDTISSTLPLPSLNNKGGAKDTPYVCTKLIEVIQNGHQQYTGFDAEVYVIGSASRQFSALPSGPDITDADKNTSTVIAHNGSTATADFSIKNNFGIFDIHITDGSHSAIYGNRHGKTKNKNHTVTPFPKLVFKKKI